MNVAVLLGLLRNPAGMNPLATKKLTPKAQTKCNPVNNKSIALIPTNGTCLLYTSDAADE